MVGLRLSSASTRPSVFGGCVFPSSHGFQPIAPSSHRCDRLCSRGVCLSNHVSSWRACKPLRQERYLLCIYPCVTTQATSVGLKQDPCSFLAFFMFAYFAHQTVSTSSCATLQLKTVTEMNTTTALPDVKPEERFSLEEIDHDGKAAVKAKGGTTADEREMQRMGKAQELRVRLPYRCKVVAVLTARSATSSSYVSVQLNRCCDDDRLF